MISFGRTLKVVEKFTIDNSPLLLTVVGVVGTISTAILTHKATVRSTLDLVEIDEERRQSGEAVLTRKEVFEETWKYYIPPVMCGALTITSIVGSNRIGTRRAAALAAAYTISAQAAEEYREKVIERIGASKEKDIRDDVARERMERTSVREREVIIASGDVLCFDAFTGRYFQSDMESIRRAENDTNQAILNEGYQSLSDFYERIGLPATDASEEVGWTTDKMLSVEFSTHLSENGKPCICVNFTVSPVRGYHKFS